MSGPSDTVRLTVAQALVRFLAAQHVERDGVREKFFAGCLGIFGHGNVAGLGEALYASREDFPYIPGRNEQSLVHIAAGYARQRDRLGAYAVTTSIGPGATNLVTGAALATINRLPVLLLPGDVFATRAPHPVLQGLEAEHDGTASVNDALRPVSRYFDRIVRPEQLVPAALEAMRVLTDPAQTGAVTLALPQDVQAEVVEVPAAFLEPRTWLIQRQPPAPEGLERAVAAIRGAQRPLVVAGGGVIYSRACEALRAFASETGIPVGETFAGRGALPSDHAGALGAVGATGTAAANRLAREADLVIGIGTRYSDFTTASKTAFQDPGVAFVNVNVCAFDAGKHAGLQVVGDARVTLDALRAALADAGWSADAAWTARAEAERAAWAQETARVVALPDAASSPLTQASVIGAVNDAAGETGVVVQAAGSLPGDLHKLWVARDPVGKGFHVEYGYSCMGYELPGAMGVKLAAPERMVYALVGDGSYLMSPGELATAVALRTRIVVVLVQNHGYASIGALSRSVGGAGFGTHHRVDDADAGAPVLDDAAGDALAAPAHALPIDLAANVASLGIPVTRAASLDELRAALAAARDADGPVAIHVEVDRFHTVGGYESWWDVPVAAVSERDAVVAARASYERERAAQRAYLRPA